MADTERTVSALQTLFRNNTAGEISPSDLRDFLVSAAPAFASYHISASAETTIETQNVYVKVAGTTTQINNSGKFTHTDNKLVYTGTPTIHLAAWAAISFTDGNNKVFAFRFAENGTTVAATEQARKTGTGTDIGALPLVGDFDMATNDYLEVFVENETDTTNVTIDNMYVFVMGILK